MARACLSPTGTRISLARRRACPRTFTRNFVVQATAAEWALCVLAELRRRLATAPDGRDGELVFFQHDEVVVHTRNADAAAAHIEASVGAATRLMFGDTAVRFPMSTDVRPSYADGESEPAE